MDLLRLSAAEVAELGGPVGRGDALRELVPAGESVARAGSRDPRRRARRAATPPWRADRRFDTGGREPAPLLVEPEQLDDAIRQMPLELVAGLQVAIANVAEVADAGTGRGRHAGARPGPAAAAAGDPRRLGRRLRARRARPLPEHGRDGRRHRPRGRRDRRRRLRAPGPDGEIDPAVLGTCRLCGVERVYRMGGAQAVAALAYGTETVARRRRDRRAPETSTSRRPSASSPASSASTASPAPRTCSSCSAPRAASTRSRLAALDMLAQAEHGNGSLVGGRLALRGAHRAPRTRAASAGSSNSPRWATPPSRSSTVEGAREAIALANAFARRAPRADRRGRRGARRRVRSAGCLFVGAESATAFGDYVAGSNHILPTAGAARFASGSHPAPLPPPHDRAARRRRGRQARRGGRTDRPRRGLRGPRRVDGGAHAPADDPSDEDIRENPAP